MRDCYLTLAEGDGDSRGRSETTDDWIRYVVDDKA